LTVVDVPTELSLKGILIGDSRISDNTIATALASATGGKPALTLMGTRHTGGSAVSHEGRSGWSTAHFLNHASLDLLGNGNAVSNAFFDPTTNCFSFAYYMQTQGYEIPDFVLINLGANDNFSKESADRINTMVASIRAYSAQCGRKIRILVLTEYLSPYEKLGVNVNVTSKREKQFRYFTYLEEVLGGREDEEIYLLPNYLAIDDWNDWQRGTVGGEEKILDVVHLGYQGYYKEEQMIRAYLYWLFGA
jgi:lysophospholipase L1-like esterase